MIDINIKRLRKQKKITQEDLARKLGVSRYLILDWEAGKVSPRVSQLKAVSVILGCSIKDLLVEEDVKVEKDRCQSRMKLDIVIQDKKRCADSFSDDVLSEMRVQIVFTDGKAHVEFCGTSRADASEADISALFDKAKAAAIAALRSAGGDAR